MPAARLTIGCCNDDGLHCDLDRLPALGYQAGIAGSKRSKASAILASSFGIMLALIIALDRPGLILVTQQPLVEVRAMMEPGTNLSP